MKKQLLSTILLLVCAFSSFAFTTVNVSGEINVDTRWKCDKQYLLKGFVYVTAGHTLTIDAGTIIKGDLDTKGTLIIERGAKIYVEGTVSSPVIFTSNQAVGSRQPGDWGGLIVCGAAPINFLSGEQQVEGGPRSKYGGSNPADNSGRIKFCRIEFSGIPFSPNNEVNGLTLCGVGNATEIDYVQVSFNGDDSYEWFGGTVNAKHIVSLGCVDDDFDTDFGYTGMNQFCVGLRDPYGNDVSGSKGFESDGYTSTSTQDTTKPTTCVFSNCTVIGPISTTTSSFNSQFIAGAHIRRASSMSLLNSIIAGFPAGVLIDEPNVPAVYRTIRNIGTNELQVRNNIIAGTAAYSSGLTNRNVVFVRNGAGSLTNTSAMSDTTSSGTDWSSLTGFAGPCEWLTRSMNRVYTNATDIRFVGSPFNLIAPNFIPNSSSDICYGTRRFPSWSAADTFKPSLPLSYDTTAPSTYNVPAFAPDFATTKASNSFFTQTNYVGAFSGQGLSSDNWMRGWTNFDPRNEAYDTICYVPTGITNIGAPTFGSAKVFPNPANGTATLLVSIKKAGEVKITIMDIAGQQVKTVFNGENTNTGDVTFDFNTSELSNGMYILCISSDNQQKNIKFSVAR